MHPDTTETYRPDTADDLMDTALVASQAALDAIGEAEAIRSLVQVARIAAGALETRGMRATGMRLRELADRVQLARGMH